MGVKRASIHAIIRSFGARKLVGREREGLPPGTFVFPTCSVLLLGRLDA